MSTLMGKMAYLSETKEAIKNAIIAKDVEVSDSDTFRSYANKIEQIPSGGNILISKTITENGIYDPADDNADGYSDVTVNISSSGNIWIDNEESQYLDENTITLKISPTGNVTIYFKGLYVTDGNIYINIIDDILLPETLRPYFCSKYFKLTKAYASDKTTQIGWIGIYENAIRLWSIDKGSLFADYAWGVLDLFGNNEQENPYTEPTYN